jgi:hypothetical protein
MLRQRLWLRSRRRSGTILLIRGCARLPMEFLHGRPLSPEELELIRRLPSMTKYAHCCSQLASLAVQASAARRRMRRTGLNLIARPMVPALTIGNAPSIRSQCSSR